VLAAQEFYEINSGDTAWVLTSAALVLLMTPGLAFFYAGMVRGKNVLTILMQNYVTIGIVSIVWVIVGFSLSFGGPGKWIGDFSYFGLEGTAANLPLTSGIDWLTIPVLAFVAFQLMFAVITPALFTGAIADRMKFGPFIVLIVAWSLLVYSPIAHMVWAKSGYLFGLGAWDFAGGTVVHANAGAAGLALALVLGKRRGWPKEPMRPHNLPFVLLGTGLLWFGWFGFNAGSALGTSNGLSSLAFITTNTATAAAMLGWLVTEKVRDGHPTTLGAASGAVAGLVAITPAAGYVSPIGSIILGLIAGTICCLATTLKFKFGFDDALDVVGVHLVGGVLGALLVGVLATTAFNSATVAGGPEGLFYGGGLGQLGKQAAAVGVSVTYSFVATWILAKVISLIFGGLRVDEDVEVEGLDINLHAETAYETVQTGGSFRSSAVTVKESTEVSA
jgi:Amt family ammonium transporter